MSDPELAQKSGDELLKRMLKTPPHKQEKKRDAAEATPRPKSQEKSQNRSKA